MPVVQWRASVSVESGHDACVSAWKDSRGVAVAFLCLCPATLREGELIKRGACRWNMLVFMGPGGHAKEQRAKEADHTQQETKGATASGHKTTPVTDPLQQDTVIKQERRVWMAGVYWYKVLDGSKDGILTVF